MATCHELARSAGVGNRARTLVLLTGDRSGFYLRLGRRARGGRAPGEQDVLAALRCAWCSSFVDSMELSDIIAEDG